MKLEYHLPRADLRDYVRSYYLFESERPTVQPMCAELCNIRFLVSGSGDVVLPDGAPAPEFDATLLGPTMAAYRVETGPGTRLFGVGVLPRGWNALFSVSAEVLADKAVDFTALAGPPAAIAAEAIRNASCLADMAAIADLFFAQRLAAAPERHAFYPMAIERWLLDPTEPGLDALVARMDVSRRQTDRIAKQYFGASPKLLQRKYRALRAADRILFDRPGDWTGAAGEAFYDQSHFIKEFKTFVGATPADYARSKELLIKEVQTRRRAQIIRDRTAIL